MGDVTKMIRPFPALTRPFPALTRPFAKLRQEYEDNRRLAYMSGGEQLWQRALQRTKSSGDSLRTAVRKEIRLEQKKIRS